MSFTAVVKSALLAGSISISSLLSAAQMPSYDKNSPDTTLIKLYHNINHKQKVNVSSRIADISASFLGQPYLLHALGEGKHGEYDESPLYRTDAFDCETYVDTVVAIALSYDPVCFKRTLNHIRYRRGRVSFVNRNHFTDLDWNRNNQKAGIVKDITLTFRDKQGKPVAQWARALIDKPSWYQHLPIDIIHISDRKQQTKRWAALKKMGKQQKQALSTIPYLPLTALFNPKGAPNTALFQQIPNAAIIEIIRPNWDLDKEIGTHLNVSHLGFAIWHHHTLFFREASSLEQHIVDIPLIDYLRAAQKSPTIKGINIQVVQPISLCQIM